MHTDINFFVMDGYLGADPDIVLSDDPKRSRARFRMATTHKVTSSETGEVREFTDWRSVVVWGAGFVENVIAPYVKKGSKVQITGRVQNTRWTDREGIERFGVEVVASSLDLLGPKPDRSADDPMPQERAAADADLDDEIPF